MGLIPTRRVFRRFSPNIATSERAIALLDAATLRPLRGSWERSTLPCGEGRDLAASGSGKRLFAPQSLGSRDGLVAYDVETLAPLHGSYEDSVLPSGPVPFAIAAHPTREIVYVASFGRNAIEYRDARTGLYLNGTAEASSFSVPSGARSKIERKCASLASSVEGDGAAAASRSGGGTGSESMGRRARVRPWAGAARPRPPGPAAGTAWRARGRRPDGRRR